MYGLYIIQISSFICLIICVNGQALYENNCRNQAIQEMHQHYDGHGPMLTQLNNLKDQLGSLRDTSDFLQFQLRCLYEKGTYEEQSVTKNQYCIMKSPSTSSTWINGKAKCQALGGYPFEINTQSEQIWFNGKISSSVGMWWIGLVLNTAENLWFGIVRAMQRHSQFGIQQNQPVMIIVSWWRRMACDVIIFAMSCSTSFVTGNKKNYNMKK